MALLGTIATIALVVSMLFIYLAQREKMSNRRSSGRQFRPDWSRSGTRAGTRRRRRFNFRR